MVKIKPLLPNLRQKKRYLAIEVYSKQSISSIDAISRSIRKSLADMFGFFGASKAELMVLKNRSSADSQMLLVKVAAGSVDMVRASLCMIRSIENIECIVTCIGASGIMKKAQARYMG